MNINIYWRSCWVAMLWSCSTDVMADVTLTVMGDVPTESPLRGLNANLVAAIFQ